MCLKAVSTSHCQRLLYQINNTRPWCELREQTLSLLSRSQEQDDVVGPNACRRCRKRCVQCKGALTYDCLLSMHFSFGGTVTPCNSSSSSSSKSSGVVTKGCPHMRGHAGFSTTLFCFITGHTLLLLLPCSVQTLSQHVQAVYLQ